MVHLRVRLTTEAVSLCVRAFGKKGDSPLVFGGLSPFFSNALTLALPARPSQNEYHRQAVGGTGRLRIGDGWRNAAVCFPSWSFLKREHASMDRIVGGILVLVLGASVGAVED